MVTLRSREELDEPKKIEDDEEQVDQENMEFEEKMEAENDKEGVKLTTKERSKNMMKLFREE